MVMDEPKSAAARPQPAAAARGLTQEFGHDVPLMLDCGIGLFAAGRSTGWAAHAREQMRERTLIRPRALYTGPAPKA